MASTRVTLTFDVLDLMAYTAWQRQHWRDWFRHEGSAALLVGTGPHADIRAVTARDIERFTEISGDRNPLHYEATPSLGRSS